MKDKKEWSWKDLKRFARWRKHSDKETEKQVSEVLDALGIKPGEIFTEADLIDKACRLFNLRKYKAKTPKELVLGLNGYPPDEIIDLLNFIMNAQNVETLFRRRAAKK